MGQPRQVEVSVDELELDPENVRSEYDADIVAGLRNALAVEGRYINPPTVYPIGNRRYRVKHGNTRVLAARGVVSSLTVWVVDPPEAKSSKLLSQMSENLLQGSLRPADIGLALKRLRYVDGRERSLSQVVGALRAVGLNRAKSWVSMHLALAELAPEVQRLMNQGQLGAEVAYQLRSLPAADQVAWAERIVRDGVSLTKVKSLLGIGGQDNDDGDGESRPEAIQATLGHRLAEAADGLVRDDSGRRSQAQPDGDRRNSRVTGRWELLPVAVRSATDDLEPEIDTASNGVQPLLAREAILLGGHPREAAMSLAERAVGETTSAKETVMAALNAVRLLVDNPSDLPSDAALSEFLAIRMKQVLRNIGRD